MSILLSRRLTVLLTLLVFCFVMVSPALAFSPVHHNESLEIPLPAFAPTDPGAKAHQQEITRLTDALAQRHGGQWGTFAWNARTSAPRYIHGSARIARTVTGTAGLEKLARQVISDNPDVFRAYPKQLALRATPHALGKWVAHFTQTYHDLEVWQARALVAFSDDGRLVMMASDCYPDIDVPHMPSLSAAEAVEIAKADVPFDPTFDRIEGETELLILPYSLSQTETEFHLVYRTRVRTSTPQGVWVTHVDAHSGQIIWRYNDIHFDYGGDTSSDVQVNTYCDGSVVQTVPYVQINVAGLGAVNSDASGNWNITGSGGTRNVTASLDGTYADMSVFGGTSGQFSGNADDGVPLTVAFDDGNTQRDERDVFNAVSDLHDFFQLFAPGFALAHMQIPVVVSRTDYVCPGNAWWDPADNSINFCSASVDYANTGEIQGVVHHEYGHGVQDALLGGWQGNEGLGEGNSDVLANMMTQESIIGRGFFVGNCTGGIRDSDNTLIYPDDVVGQPIHAAGRVIAGFHWDVMMQFQAVHGQETGTVMTATTWHTGRELLQPGNQPDQVYATFFADDDDGDLTNGTPNYDVYCTAATNHNFECPEILTGVQIAHVQHPYTGDSWIDYAIDCTATSLDGEIIPSTVTVHYRLDGGSFADVTMSSAGGDNYSGAIPAQPRGTVVEYYISAEDDQASYGTSPQDAPTTLHYFEVDDTFVDEMEVATPWTAGAPDDDASTGMWERVDPNGTTYSGYPVQPEDDHTVAGTDCWITGQGVVGGDAGDVDVDGGKTTLYSPIFDLTSAEAVNISYWKYYTNNRGNDPNNDYWDVDISNDAGGAWTSVEHTTTSTNAWVEGNLDLFTYFGSAGQVQLRFVASDEGSGSLVEAGVDDFTVAAVFGLSGAPDDGLSVRFVTDLAQNAPNPFNPQTEIRFNLGQAGPVSLKVFDVSGRLVKSLANGRLPAGEHRLIWDGTDHDGRAVATGVYFYRLLAEGKTFGKRMVLVK